MTPILHETIAKVEEHINCLFHSLKSVQYHLGELSNEALKVRQRIEFEEKERQKIIRDKINKKIKATKKIKNKK
jgi:hypothetical protein